jgi:uncharacterized protein YndB with AHSA1/START domain
METTAGGAAISANALKKEIRIEVARRASASPEAVYAVLADPRSHLVWGGERHGKGARLTSLDAEPGPLRVGSEFSSTGVDAMGTFADRSVVTEAEPARVLAFVTEGRLTTKKGRVVEWTLIHRYELVADGDGCAVRYVVRTTRISALPGPMRLFNTPGLSRLLVRFAGRGPRAGVANLIAMAEERQG